MKTAHKTIDAYIQSFEPPIQKRLEAMRKNIQKAAPEAKEAISYGMPTFKLNGNLVHFAAAKNHIGFYPTPSGIQAFLSEIDGKYQWSKGAIQFPLDQPLPLELVKKIVAFRVKETSPSLPRQS